MNNLLYKYRPDNENTEKIIIDKTLWFSSPRDFNDPFDCWVNIAEPTNEYLSKIIMKSGISDQMKQFCLPGIKNYSKDDFKKSLDGVLYELRVCCFSEICDNILMWSHYADSHKGVCFQFDILKSPTCFSLVKKVKYVNQMPLYDDSKDRQVIIEKVIQPKAINWEYESEVRIVKTPEMCNNGMKAIPFDPQSLKKIIFGCKAGKSTIKKYTDLCNDYGLQHVKFSQMRQKTNGEFQLEEYNI